MLNATDTAQFLSPEQQHLLRVRRDAERRQARWRRAGLGGALLGIAGTAAAVAWLAGLI